MTTKSPNKSELKLIRDKMSQFIEETYTPSEYMNPWDTVNKYFAISDGFEKDWKVFIRIGDKAYFIGTHSTLDISSARNFIVYFRTVFKNKLKQNDWDYDWCSGWL